MYCIKVFTMTTIAMLESSRLLRLLVCLIALHYGWAFGLLESKRSGWFGATWCAAHSAKGGTINVSTMRLRVGILGLPNVGKSSLFNSLARKSIAEAANYPFCTIEPNRANIELPSEYLNSLARFEKKRFDKTVFATIPFVDVAGVAKGAHRGEGLGNRFLGTLRDCSLLVHLVRMFGNSVNGNIDPVSDVETICLELLLADLEHVERRLERTTCVDVERATLEKIQDALRIYQPARSVVLNPEETQSIRSMGLLTLKNIIYAFNVDEVDFLFAHNEAVETARLATENFALHEKDRFTIVSAKLEARLTLLAEEQQLAFLADMGVEMDQLREDWFSYSKLPSLVRDTMELNQIYTGPGVPIERSKTVKAHLMRPTATADDLAGRLHGDIQDGFLSALVIPAKELLRFDSWKSAKDDGAVRSEGRDYILQHNDVVCIRWKS